MPSAAAAGRTGRRFDAGRLIEHVATPKRRGVALAEAEGADEREHE